MRTLLTGLVLITLTPILGSLVIVLALLGRPYTPGSLMYWAPQFWVRSILSAAGVRIRVHGHPPTDKGAHIFVGNHTSWFDIFVLVDVLPGAKFVGKAELFRIPIFGRAATALGMIPIQRDNRKAAFESYRVAATRIADGDSIVVFPEGTRGFDYHIRPFKKGPFVLAVSANAPLVPTLIHGTLAVQRKGAFRIRSGDVDVHFLEPVGTEGLGYDDRDELAQETWTRLANAMQELYGVESPVPRLRAAS